MRTFIARKEISDIEGLKAAIATAIKNGSTSLLPTFSKLEVGKVYVGKVVKYLELSFVNDGKPQHLNLYELEVQIDSTTTSKETVAILEDDAKILPIGFEGQVECIVNETNQRKVNRWYKPKEAAAQTMVNPVPAASVGA